MLERIGIESEERGTGNRIRITRCCAYMLISFLTRLTTIERWTARSGGVFGYCSQCLVDNRQLE